MAWWSIRRSIAAVEAAENHALKPCEFIVVSQFRAI
jgi:hypothetical protein